MSAYEIFAAISRRDLAAVKACVKSGTDIDCPEAWDRKKPVTERSCGWSPLEHALYLDPSPEKTGILAWLLEAGASLAAVTEGMAKYPPLCVVANLEDVAGADILLKAGADPCLEGEDGSPLEVAVASGNIQMVKRLLKAGARFPAERTDARAILRKASSSREMIVLLKENGLHPAGFPRLPGDPDGMLDDLILRGDTGQIEFMVAQGVDFGDTVWDQTSRLLLTGSDAEFSNHLLEKKPDLTKTYGYRGKSLCRLAAERDLASKLRMLLDAGAGPDFSAQEFSPGDEHLLHAAAMHGSVQCLKLLLSLRLPVDQPGRLGYTPLMEACGCGRLEAVRMLLDAGASVDPVDEFSQTALNHLTERAWHDPAECLEILKLLHGHGADLNHINNLREGIVRDVTNRGFTAALRWLVQQGAHLKQNSIDGTPLRRAVLNDDLECMEILLRAGADPNQRLEDDETALFDVRSAAGVRLLLKHGADPALKDDLFDRTAEESVRDPLIKAAFHEGLDGSGS